MVLHLDTRLATPQFWLRHDGNRNRKNAARMMWCRDCRNAKPAGVNRRAASSRRRILRGGSPIPKGATDRAGRSAAGRSKLPFKARPEMREELPMDYIDLLKRVAIPLGTIMVLSSALAQEQLTKADLVQLAVTLGVYDNRCEKLAPRLLADVQRMVRMLDKDDVMAAVINEQDKVDRAGEAKWCVALRPVVEKYKDGLFEPVR
jgi:hypothetical protein